MNYCKKCARIVDSDSDVCPYCGSSEAEFDELLNKDSAQEVSEKEQNYSYEADTHSDRDLDIYSSPEVYREPKAYNTPEVYSAPEAYEKPPEFKENNSEDFYNAPYVEEHSGSSSRYQKDVNKYEPEKEVDPALKIMMTIITVLFPYAGLIAAIIFMNSSSTSYKSTGKLLLIISLIELALGILCCCGIIAIMTAAA